MSWLEVVVLAVVQGLTEFLPISSSAHLRLVSEVFFGRDAGAAFTAVTQLGTEAAVLVYFARDIGSILLTWLRGFRDPDARATGDYRLAWLVIVGTLPIVVFGIAFESRIQTAARNLWLTATVLIVFGLLLGLAERVGRQKTELRDMTWADGVILGFAQALALVPGVSRSGGTITAGLFLGLTRPATVRYSFLLALPSVLGAGFYQLPDALGRPGSASVAQIAVATVVAFALGYATIAWLLRYVARHSVYVFVWYRVLLGSVLLVALGAGWLAPY